MLGFTSILGLLPVFTALPGLMKAGAAIGAAGGLVQAIQGKKMARQAARRAEEARARLEEQKDRFRNLDTSNPYLNMENMYEDLTVNQQEAEFAKQQSLQANANIMDQMRQASGASGIAALAQTLSSQQALQAQKAAASIGTQEQANQLKAAEEAAKIQGLEREGELISRQAEFGKIQSLMGMEADELSNQLNAQQQAREQQIAGISQIGSSVMNFASVRDIGDTIPGGVTPTNTLMNKDYAGTFGEGTGTMDLLGNMQNAGQVVEVPAGSGIKYICELDGSLKRLN